METLEKAVGVVDHVAAQPPLWWFIALILIGIFMLAVVGRVLLRRIEKLEREIAKARQEAADARKETAEVRKETETYLKDRAAEMVAALTRAAQALDRSADVIDKNNSVLAELTVRLQVATASPVPLNLR